MYKYSLIVLTALLLAGCENRMEYASACELPPLKFPADALAVSHRYDIPKLAGNNCPVIDVITPPYY